MYVCLCHGVTDQQLKQHVRSGADTLEKVGKVCGAGTCCGCCSEMIRDIIDEHRPEPINVAHAPAAMARELRQVS